MKSQLFDAMRGFRTIWISFLVFAAACVIASVATALFPELLYLLCSSVETPWGIVTGIFVHSLDSHLFGNLFAIMVYLLVFTTIAGTFSLEPKEDKEAGLIITVAVAAVFSNVVSLVFAPQVRSIGSSGVGFAILGVTFAESLKNALLGGLYVICLRRPVPPAFVIRNSFVFAFIAICLLSAPAAFFTVAPGVNFLVHIYAFFSGCFSYLTLNVFRSVYELFLSRKVDQTTTYP